MSWISYGVISKLFRCPFAALLTPKLSKVYNGLIHHGSISKRSESILWPSHLELGQRVFRRGWPSQQGARCREASRPDQSATLPGWSVRGAAGGLASPSNGWAGSAVGMATWRLGAGAGSRPGWFPSQPGRFTRRSFIFSFLFLPFLSWVQIWWSKTYSKASFHDKYYC